MSGGGYSPGHPWFYILGGAVMPIAEIERSARSHGSGYLHSQINDIAAHGEPTRSRKLKEVRAQVLLSLEKDRARYLEVAEELERRRVWFGPWEDEKLRMHNDLPTAMSLKYNHLWNDFGNLAHLDNLTEIQMELF